MHLEDDILEESICKYFSYFYRGDGDQMCFILIKA